jgi:hypothetical protein
VTTKLERTFRIDDARSLVMEVMRSPAFIEESERSRDALEAKVVELERTAARHRYDICTKTYARTVTGIDRSKTDDNKTEVTWDLEKHAGRWVFRGPHGPKVSVTGGYALTEKGPSTELLLTVEIEIGIPLVAKMVEKKVGDGFLENWPPYVERLKRHVAAARK